jgi:hypothetical protein
MNDWQPIDTAPQDGRRFLAFGKSELDHPDNHSWITIVSMQSEGGSLLTDDNVWFTALCWQPLPAAPKAI